MTALAPCKHCGFADFRDLMDKARHVRREHPQPRKRDRNEQQMLRLHARIETLSLEVQRFRMERDTLGCQLRVAAFHAVDDVLGARSVLHEVALFFGVADAAILDVARLGCQMEYRRQQQANRPESTP